MNFFLVIGSRQIVNRPELVQGRQRQSLIFGAGDMFAKGYPFPLADFAISLCRELSSDKTPWKQIVSKVG